MSGASLSGIDVSNFQGNVDWSQVKAAGYSFAFAKATEGAGFTDASFQRNWQGMAAAGITRGAYHFARPDLGNSPIAEAEWFLTVVGPLQPSDLLAVDLEAGNGDLSAWARLWLDHTTQQVGFKPLWYSYPNFIIDHGLGALFSTDYGQWIANPASAWNPAFVQLVNGGSVPGVAGACDLDEFGGDATQLAAYGAPAPGGNELALTPDQEAQLVDMLSKFPNLYRTVGDIFWTLQITGADPDPTKAHSAVLDNLTAAVKALQGPGGGATEPAEPAEPKTLTIQGPITGTIT